METATTANPPGEIKFSQEVYDCRRRYKDTYPIPVGKKVSTLFGKFWDCQEHDTQMQTEMVGTKWRLNNPKFCTFFMMYPAPLSVP